MSDKANNNLKSAYSFIEDVEYYLERAKAHAVGKELTGRIERCMMLALDLKWKIHDIINFNNNDGRTKTQD